MSELQSPTAGEARVAKLPAEDKQRVQVALSELSTAGMTAIEDVAALAATCRTALERAHRGSTGSQPPPEDGLSPRSARMNPHLSRLPQDALARVADMLDELAKLGMTAVSDCAALAASLQGSATPQAEVDTEFHDDPDKMFEGDYRIADCSVCAEMIAEDRFEPHWANGVEPPKPAPSGSMRRRSLTTGGLPSNASAGTGMSGSMRKRAGTLDKDTKQKMEKPGSDASHGVLETTKVTKGEDEAGNKTINEYTVLTELGRGAYGKVKLVVHVKTEKHYAIKIMNKSVLSKIKKNSACTGSATGLDDALREIAIMKRLEHPNVVTLHEVIDDPECNKLYLILDFVERGPVCKITTDPARPVRPLATEKIKGHLIDICQGLDYLHFHHIIHRDIKPDNILVSEDGVAKLTDFGVSHSVDNKEPGEQVIDGDTEGTPAFLTPEQLRGEKIPARMADIWALGVTVYCMAFGAQPFTGESFQELVASIEQCEPSYAQHEMWADVKHDERFLDMLKHILHKSLSKRLGNDQGVRDVLLCPFLKGQANAELREHGKRIEVTAEDAANAVLTGHDIVLNFGNAVGVMMQTKAAVRGFKGMLAGKKGGGTSPNAAAAACPGFTITTDPAPPQPKITAPIPQVVVPSPAPKPEVNVTLELNIDDAERSIRDVDGDDGTDDEDTPPEQKLEDPPVVDVISVEGSPRNLDSPSSKAALALSPTGGGGGGQPQRGGGSFRLGAGSPLHGSPSFVGPRLTHKRSFRTEEEVVMEEAQDGDVGQTIENAKAQGWTDLTLNCYKFEEFPDNLLECVELCSLTAHLNGLKVLTSRITELSMITYLNLGQNELRTLPAAIGDMPNLRTLDLNRNKIFTLPEEIGKLQSLRTINLDYNQLDELPVGLTKIKELEKCYLVQNEDITSFPNLGDWEDCTMAVTNTPVLLTHWAIKQHKYPGVTILWDKVYPDQITEHVFLGSLRCTQTEKVFRVLNITAIVTAGKGLQVMDPLPQGVEQLALNVDDSPDQTLVPFFEQVTDYINSMAKQDRRVLVHCFAGLSRSVTFVCAYLMKQRRMTFKNALLLVKRARPAVNPNQGFRKQLIDYEYKLYGTKLDPQDIENWPNGPGVDPTQFQSS
eukprot:TRINITY_DN5201_c0_g1_i3.p1 TRINITY_DN5201_c0_g1~~TRINITY_DN5201_c0_g1_i3.p1  ORF type:complete len:1118 (+),score=372.55 TRINITY_DN5201_c0_g1_i3:147-3500(+)